MDEDGDESKVPAEERGEGGGLEGIAMKEEWGRWVSGEEEIKGRGEK